MQQLVQPNLTISGQIGLCLQYVANVFSCKTGDPTAWDEWGKVNQHKDRNFPSGVYFPIWFSYFTTINGVYGNFGHVAVMTPTGEIYSSPWKLGTTHAVLPSIDELIRIYSNGGQFPMQYVGWSDNILEKQVIKETEVNLPNDGDIINAKRFSTGSPTYQPTGPELDFFKDPNNGWKSLLYDTMAGGQVQIDLAKSGGKAPQVLSPGIYKIN